MQVMYELLMFTLINIPPLCLAIKFPRVFEFKETIDEYEQRMSENNLPIVGDSYETYSEWSHQEFEDGKPINARYFQIFMGSIPRIYETVDSVNIRNSMTATQESDIYGLQIYTVNLINWLMEKRYPRLYETYREYSDRIHDIGEEAVPISIFKGFKHLCPNIGESYKEYYDSRYEQFGLKGWDEEDFDSFVKLFPLPGESIENYFDKVYDINRDDPDEAAEFYKWVEMTNDDYYGLKRLMPVYNESYDSYTERMDEICICPISVANFEEYQEKWKVYEDKKAENATLIVKAFEMAKEMVWGKLPTSNL